MTRGEAVNWLINITADIGKAEHSELWHYEQALTEIREMLESEPERKKGKWLEDDEQIHVELTYHCSECGFQAWGENEKTDYCGGCGADMRGDADG